MNEFIVLGTVTQDPQLRYTPDNQTPISEMWIEFDPLRDDDSVSRIKVVGWGNMAQAMQEQYHQGDRVIVEGRLGMNMIDRQEGFKEKRAELTARRIHRVNANASLTTVASAPAEVTPKAAPAATNGKPKVNAPTPPVQPPVGRAKATSSPTGKGQQSPASRPPAGVAPAADPTSYDEIPFFAPLQHPGLMHDDPIDFIDADLNRPAVGFESRKY